MHILQGYIHTYKQMKVCPCPERFKGQKTEMIKIEECTNVQNNPMKMLDWFLVCFLISLSPQFPPLCLYRGWGVFLSLDF